MGKELEACKQQGLGACETLLKSYKELSDENREAMLACDTVECWQKARAGMDGGLDGLKELVAANSSAEGLIDSDTFRATAFIGAEYNQSAHMNAINSITQRSEQSFETYSQSACGGAQDAACMFNFVSLGRTEGLITGAEILADTLTPIGSIKDCADGNCLGMITELAGPLGKLGEKALKPGKNIGKAGDGKVSEKGGAPHTTSDNQSKTETEEGQSDVGEGVKLLPPASSIGSARRSAPGVASHGGSLTTIGEGDNWLRGSNGNAGLVPSQIAEQLAGKEFRNFDHFREEFWKAAANDPVLRRQFDTADQFRMKNGYAPRAQVDQQVGGRVKYELDHNQELQNGGNVYDMNNIIIRTPLNHMRGK